MCDECINIDIVLVHSQGLQESFSSKTSVDEKKRAFLQWGIDQVSEEFPGIGKTGYSVPPYFINRHEITFDSDTGSFKRTREAEKNDSTDHDSDVRGDSAERRVERAFRVSK